MAFFVWMHAIYTEKAFIILLFEKICADIYDWYLVRICQSEDHVVVLLMPPEDIVHIVFEELKNLFSVKTLRNPIEKSI